MPRRPWRAANPVVRRPNLRRNRDVEDDQPPPIRRRRVADQPPPAINIQPVPDIQQAQIEDNQPHVPAPAVPAQIEQLPQVPENNARENCIDQYDVWSLGYSPIKNDILENMLQNYPNKLEAKLILDGFKYGFKLNYTGLRLPQEYGNLLPVKQNPAPALKKIQNEIDLGRMAGPFNHLPISNLRCSPIGLVPKKTGGERLITHLSYPKNFSVNDHIDESYTKVSYSSFDNTINMIQKLGENALIAKMDIKSAFRLLKVYPGDFDLLGIKLLDKYYIDKCMPFGCSISCASFEKFSTQFLHWAVQFESKSNNLDHYLDDFLFAGKEETQNCQVLMTCFENICKKLGVPIASEKTEGPSTVIDYLGLTINTEKMQIQIPIDKITKLIELIDITITNKKVTLRHMQSLAGSLAFCTKALPSGRAFCRRLYGSFKHATKPHHFIRVTKGIRDDLLIWKLFLKDFNGVSYMQDLDWVNSPEIELFTDSAGRSDLGCGAYLQGSWTFMNWPSNWTKEICNDMTYLEIIPEALSIYLWGKKFENKKVLLHCDNEAVVHILNVKSSKSERVMTILRHIVYWTLLHNCQIKAVYISTTDNKIADYLSRGQMDKFIEAAPNADKTKTEITEDFY